MMSARWAAVGGGGILITIKASMFHADG